MGLCCRLSYEAIRVEEATGDSLLQTAPPEVTPEHLRRLLLQRRSVRRYEARPVPRQTLEEMLEVARWVPTAANCQCVRYTVILDPVLRDEVAAEVTVFYRAYNEALEDREHTAERLAEIGVNAEFGMHPHMLAAVPAFVKNMERGRDRLFFSAPAVTSSMLTAASPAAGGVPLRGLRVGDDGRDAGAGDVPHGVRLGGLGGAARAARQAEDS